jgi:hypothetical protein
LEIDDAQLKTLIIELDDLGRSRQRLNRQQEAEQLMTVIRDPSAVAPRVARPAPGGATTSEDDVRRIIEKGRLRHGISAPTDG